MILTIDQGTTSSRALVIAPDGKILGIAQKEFKQIYPKPGWVEHDPIEIWETTLAVCREVISKLLKAKKISAKDIKGIAITNQRETTVLWDKRTGKPVYNAIVWQCRRTADHCKNLREDKKFTKHVHDKTGLLIDSYFSGPKLAWLLNENQKQIKKIGIENLLFGTIDTWILWNLTKGNSHFTEPSNASRTMLFDIHDDSWDSTILKKLKIPRSLLPTVIDSDGDFGTCSLFNNLGLKDLKIKAILGDQQAAWYAHKESPKITYGTGTFILLPNNSGVNVDGMLTSVGYRKSGKKSSKTFILEGSIFIGGAIVQWLRDELKIISKSSEIEMLSGTVVDNGGVYLIPALVGLGAPHWREDLKGAIFGITRGSNRGHIARAALESMAYSVKDVFEVFEKSLLLQKNPRRKISEKKKLNLQTSLLNSIGSINVDGGASKNDLLMQFQADLLGIEIRRFTETEMTALGVARMTGDVDYKIKPVKIFKPKMDLSKNYLEWKNYLDKLLA